MFRSALRVPRPSSTGSPKGLGPWTPAGFKGSSIMPPESEDYLEGRRAFLEKRSPVFRDR